MRPRIPLVTLSAFGMLVLAAACGRDRPGEEESPPSAAAPAAGEVPSTGGRVYEVRMRTTRGGEAGVFDPARLTARRGDVIRFVLADADTTHGVSFPTGENPQGAALPSPSPLMRQVGQVYELPVDLAPGTYTFVCPSHAASGMRGTLTVEP